MTTAATALAAATERLRAHSDAPRTEALMLLEATLEKSRSWIVAYGERPLSENDAALFGSLCERRASGVPTAYLVRSAGFYGHELYVDERVLIPRPESEHLVDEALRFLGDREGDVLDVGTGSGALACSIAAASRATVYATDISSAAVTVACENVRRLGLEGRCIVARGDLIEPFAGRRFDVVVANLPYVPACDLPAAPDPVSFEPRLALDGGPDGLTQYRRLLQNIARALQDRAMVLLEAAPPTIQELARMTRFALPECAVDIRCDYAGKERYVRAVRVTAS